MNRTLKIVLKLVITVFFLWLVYDKVNLTQIQEHIERIQLWPLLLFFAILFLNTLISAIKWRLFLHADGVEIPVSSLFASYLIGSFFNLFLPSTIGGDAYRIFSIKQHNAKFSKSFASVFADRLSGFFALACFGLVFSIIGFETLPHHLCFLVPLIVFLLILGAAVFVMSKALALKALNILHLNRFPRIGSEIEKMLNSFATYSRDPWLIVKILGWSFLFQFLVITCIAILARAINLDIPASAFFIFVPIITLLEALPVSIYGLGLRDAGYVFFLTEMAVMEPAVNAAALSLLYVSTTVLYVSMGGLLFLFRLLFFNKSRIAPRGQLIETQGVWQDGKTLTIGIMLRHIDERGGINVYSRNMVFSLLNGDSTNRYVLFTPAPTFYGKLRKYPNAEECVVRTGALPMRKISWDQVHVLEAMGRLKVDLIFNPKLSVPLMANCKTVFTMHGMEQFAARRFYPFQDRIYYSLAMQLYCARADGILVMTQTGKTDLQRYLHVPGEKIHVIPESFNEGCVRVSDPEALARSRDEWQLPEKFILFVGGITPLKNIPTLLSAFKQLKDRGYTHKLVLVGFRRWNFAKDIELIEALGLQKDVIELGFVSDEELSVIYSLADIFVLPSFYEGFGIPILEAQSCGCPVITSGVGGMIEVVGGAGLHFNPSSPDELMNRIEQILGDKALRESLIMKGHENARRYCWQNTARKTIELFNWIGRQ